MKVEFFFDVGSPASYLAWTQLPKICAAKGAELVFRPMLLGAIFQATGNASPAAVPVKGRHSGIDLGRFAKRYGVPLVMNPHFPVNTLQLMRAVTGVQMHQPERFEHLLKTLFDALWIDALNLNEPALIGRTLIRAGFSIDEILALANSPDVKAQLRSTTDEALERGVFGAPTCFVGDQMFFGQDRLDFVEEALA
ncbi:2-hydroxychromene-2-carboxylate isomerase [Pseudomonas sp. WS 5106]|jgi:2-hydroxychromene-2-carboxylate isomerase|uniref:2-hydroxychromene-2-carboxylate isomerase n=2 Tax=Gammaproteobacteria TaxID=1236 RepID=A0A7X1E289_9PSED|nr:2-hydroxychromene-2-carboxylate isomerase [Pseudomonas cremoris]MBC2384293.1 2-hydroxychromene-2-carboxylate isomerase [Pseudomonas cremoris]MBC2410376.1 2-hydroxychromene-2-carboxylate isomerase [Pseudomonas cremoris]